MTEQPKSWRDLIKVHPAADLFPMMGADELRRLARTSGRTGDFCGKPTKGKDLVLVDGHNRLDAMEAAGLPAASGAAVEPSDSGEVFRYVQHARVLGADATTCVSVISEI